MKTDQIYSSFLFSLCLHSLFVVAAIFYMLFFSPRYKTVTFDVDLVSPSQSSSTGAAQKSIEAQAPEQKSTHTTEQPEKVTKKEKSEVNERIAALEAKKKIESLARLRKSVGISVAKGVTGAARIQTAGASGSAGSDYISLIGTRIHQQWLFPETADKDLLAVINIKISTNGSVTIIGWEKKSGNPLFDRAALRAINNAAPLPPPPREMEIGVRFTP